MNRYSLVGMGLVFLASCDAAGTKAGASSAVDADVLATQADDVSDPAAPDVQIKSTDVQTTEDATAQPVVNPVCAAGFEKVLITDSYPLPWENSSGDDFVLRAIGYGMTDFYTDETRLLVPQKAYNQYCLHQEVPFTVKPGDAACLKIDNGYDAQTGFDGYDDCYIPFTLEQIQLSTANTVLSCTFMMEVGDTPPQQTAAVKGVTLSVMSKYAWYEGAMWELPVDPTLLSGFSLKTSGETLDQYVLQITIPQLLFFFTTPGESLHWSVDLLLTVGYETNTTDDFPAVILRTSLCDL